ncbi:MAG: hypothetical protein ACRC0V_05120 [Fusobacteriaceae bacterium]
MLRKIIMLGLLLFVVKTFDVMAEEKTKTEAPKISTEKVQPEFLEAKLDGTKSFEEEKPPYQKELRLMTSLVAYHNNWKNKYYNNHPNLISLEWRFREKWGVAGGFFINSFYKDAYALTLNRYFYPFDQKLPGFHFYIGAGIVKGYHDNNQLIVNGKVIVNASYPTNIGKDYIAGLGLGVGYDITDRVAFQIMYLGAYLVNISVKLN